MRRLRPDDNRHPASAVFVEMLGVSAKFCHFVGLGA
jgi:hypothetical protein